LYGENGDCALAFHRYCPPCKPTPPRKRIIALSTKAYLQLVEAVRRSESHAFDHNELAEPMQLTLFDFDDRGIRQEATEESSFGEEESEVEE
jgi:hypothetical protein